MACKNPKFSDFAYRNMLKSLGAILLI